LFEIIFFYLLLKSIANFHKDLGDLAGVDAFLSHSIHHELSIGML